MKFCVLQVRLHLNVGHLAICLGISADGTSNTVIILLLVPRRATTWYRTGNSIVS